MCEIPTRYRLMLVASVCLVLTTPSSESAPIPPMGQWRCVGGPLAGMLGTATLQPAPRTLHGPEGPVCR